MSQIPY